MITYVWIAIASTIGMTLAVHLGLTSSIARVASRIARCNMCATFWFTLVILLLCETHPLVAALLSILGSYASNWLLFLLIILQRKYDEIWQRINKPKTKDRTYNSHSPTER